METIEVKISGIDLADRIKELRENITALNNKFTANLTQFAQENADTKFKVDLVELLKSIDMHEQAVSTLQLVQTEYNINNIVVYEDEQVNLHYLVKILGGIGRVKNLYALAADIKTTAPTKYDGLRAYGSDTKNADTIYKEKAIDETYAFEQYQIFSKKQREIEKAIRRANAVSKTMIIPKFVFEL